MKQTALPIHHNYKRLMVAALVFMIALSSAIIIGLNVIPRALGTEPMSTQHNLPVYTATQLKAFDGTDPNKPIYLAMDGAVYDVTAGKEFYQTGGDYHDLAGRDATAELHFAGGAIIKRKYPVIGYLSPE